MYYCGDYDSPVGRLTVASDEDHIVGLWIRGQRFDMDILDGAELFRCETDVIAHAKGWLDRYFWGKRPDVSEIPIRFIGTDFRCAVWKLLAEIPYGVTVTYGDIACRIADLSGKARMSAQAVGGAVGRNPISIIVPCHRVVGANGSLVGYSGGVDIKLRLLEHEGIDTSGLYIPSRKAAL